MAKNTKNNEDGQPIIIKKYANRRLYNTQTSSYITLDFLAEMTRKDTDFKVVDAKSGEDITHNVLTQIIMEEENSGQNMLPVGFLRQLISMYGGSMQSMVPQYLEASMDSFRKNQREFESAIEGALTSGPLGHIAKQNIEMMKAAREAFDPLGLTKREKKDDVAQSAEPAQDQPEPEAKESDDVAALKQQMAELQAKLDKLDS